MMCQPIKKPDVKRGESTWHDARLYCMKIASRLYRSQKALIRDYSISLADVCQELLVEVSANEEGKKILDPVERCRYVLSADIDENRVKNMARKKATGLVSAVGTKTPIVERIDSDDTDDMEGEKMNTPDKVQKFLPDIDDFSPGVINNEIMDMMLSMIGDKLDDPDKFLLFAKFGVGYDKEWSETEIGNVLGISQQAVSKRFNKIIESLGKDEKLEAMNNLYWSGHG